MLKTDYIYKKLGSFELKNISFHLPCGYIMGLVGENGAGKSSLIKILLGLYHSDGSTIQIDGMDLNNENEAPKIKDIIGFVLNEDWFSPALTLLENADCYVVYYQRYSREAFLSFCSDFELNSSKKLKKCSKGEKLKFQFAFALSHSPKLLILDEPLANFDPEFRETFIRLITAFIKDGDKSILIATHLIEELEQYTDYIAYLEKGELLFFKEIETLKDEYSLVTGDACAIQYLKKEDVIYRQDSELSSKALIKNRTGMILDRDLKIERPSLEELMYFFMKGRKAYDKKNSK